MLVGAPTFLMANPASRAHCTIDSEDGSVPIPSTPQLVVGSTSTLSLTIPVKLSCRILELEYAEMTELIPEIRGLEPDTASLCCHQGCRQTHRGLVIYILLWIECYSSLAAVLAPTFSQHIGDVMAYQKNFEASKNFEGTALVIYECCYRRRAATMKSLEWAKIDSALYNKAFTGWAQIILLCQFCLSENHMETKCQEKSPPMPGHSGGGQNKITGWSSFPGRSLPYVEQS